MTTIPGLVRACDMTDPDSVTVFLVASRADAGPDGTVRAIESALGDLHAFTNQELVDRLQAQAELLDAAAVELVRLLPQNDDD